MQTEGIFNKHIKIRNAQYLNSFVPFFGPIGGVAFNRSTSTRESFIYFKQRG